MGSTQTVSVLMTDLVGSTRMAGELGSRWDGVLPAHLGELETVVEHHGGTKVKGVGDGLMAVFRSASDALSCAVAMQQGVELRNRRTAPPLGMRIGIGSGDAEEVDGDWYGWPPIEARRLCDLAGAGEVLVTETVRRVAAPADGRVFELLGPLELKGFAEPVATWRLRWPAAATDAVAAPLPAPLSERPAGGFVGRAAEHRRLAAEWQRAQGGERCIALVGGEAGIGKTTLAARLAADAHRDGAFVLYGRSEQDVGLPYEPWRQALGHLLDCLPDAALAHHVARHGHAIAPLVPHMVERMPQTSPAAGGDPETERYLLFGAVAGLLEDAAAERAILLVLDDLQWAGRPTLGLLKHVQLAAPQMRLLVLGTHRDTSRRPDHPLHEVLEGLRRHGHVERVELGGLSPVELQRMLDAAATAPDRPGDAVAQELHAWTDGNPFFVAETIRHLHETGGRWTSPGGLRALALPRSVVEVIRGRVGRLGPDAARLLQCAAVIGRDFDVDLLTAVAEGQRGGAVATVDEMVDILDAAVGASLIVEQDDEDGRYRFVHALVARALETDLGGARRARLHERIALAQEARLDDGAPVTDIARHWGAAAGPRARRKAVEYRVCAGRAALADLAPDEALEWFEAARADADPASAVEREVLLGVGEAEVHAGRPEFRETLLDAADRSRRAGDRDRLIRAALLNNRGMFSSSGQLDEERLAVLEAALAESRADDPRRARLLALLAAELLWSGDHARRRAVSDEAVGLARARGDGATLAYVLVMRVTAVWSPNNLAERLAVTDEAVALSDRAGDPLQRFWALVWRAATLVQAGDLVEADERLAGLREVAARVGHPRLHFVATAQRVWREQLAGRLPEAERLVEEARAIGEQAGEPDAMTLFAAQFLQNRWHQGRLGDEAGIAAFVAKSAPRISLFQAIAAIASYESGERDDAFGFLRAAGHGRFRDLPEDPVTLGALTLWAELAARLGDLRSAAALVPRLEPFRAQVVTEALGTLGVVSRCLGGLATLLGRHAEARRHFEHALETHERLGAHSLATRTRVEWGLALAEHGEPVQARQLLAAGAHEAARLELSGLERVARRAMSDIDARPPQAAARSGAG